VRYEYRLSEQDTHWHGPIEERSVTFARLSPGDYTFEVRARNADGRVSQRPARVAFTILAPFWKQWWFAALSVVLALGAGGVLVRTRIHRILELNTMRERIAQDLHDDIGSNLTGIAIASKVVHDRERRGESSHAELLEIASTAMLTLDLLRDIVWLINPANDSLEDLVLRMKESAASILGSTPYVFRPLQDLDNRKIDLERKRSIFLMYKEMLANALKHAHAGTIEISVTHRDRTLTVKVSDDGVGFDPSAVTRGNGIRNLRTRAAAMNASFDVESQVGRGSTFCVAVPLT
jgi:signal transduction histidine kinase